MQIGGFDAEQIVSGLMQIEQLPLRALEARREQARTAATAIGTLRTSVESFRFASLKLADVSTFRRFTATSSDSSAVTAAASADATPGALSFNVDRLARSHGLRSVGTVSSAGVAVTTSPVIALATGTRALGVDTVRAGAGLAAGDVELTVVQASAAARSVGATPLAASTTITAGVDDRIDLEVDGVARSVTIAAGTYDAAALAAAVDAALDGAGADATLDSTGALTASTQREGSTATLRLTGGTALAALGWTVEAVANTGTDGVIDVGGTLTTVTAAQAGTTVAVDTGAGTLDVTLAGGLRVGAGDVTVVSTGDRSLTAVAAAVNQAGAGMSASAVRIDDTTWRLQLSATSSGEDGRIAVDGSVFDGLGGLVESSAAQNAQITVGQGAGAYSIESSTNTFADVLGGITFTAKATTTQPVTVDVRRDDAAIADDVGKLVSAANTLLAEIKVQTRYGVDGTGGGALAGNGSIRRLADDVRRALGAPVASLGAMLPSTVGIQSTRDGSFTFDRATFLAAIADDPEAVTRLFGRGATTSAGVTFTDADPTTLSGSYAVEVTTAATRATSARLFDGGVGADARLGVRVGDVTVTYDVTAGQTAAQAIDGLNAALAQGGLGLVAEADAGGVRLRAVTWGSSGDFELNTDVDGVGTWSPVAGTDVVGTINGIAATGIGRELSLNPLVDSPAAGLVLTIDEGVTGPLGDVVYQPGLAARVAEVTTALTDGDTGLLQGAKDAADRRVESFNDQIERLEDRLLIREVNLRRQWANLQTVLEGLQNQGGWISSQLATLPQINPSS